MYTQIIVPFDGGEFSSRAIPVGKQLAQAMNAPLRIVAVAATAAHGDMLTAAIKYELPPLADVETTWTVRRGVPAAEIAKEWSDEPGALVCMSSVGRSRTAPMLGSVAEGVLQEMYGPVLLLGPHVRDRPFDVHGAMIVCSDGSPVSDTMLPVAAQWAITLPLEPWVVSVCDPDWRPIPAELRDDVATDITHAWQKAHQLEQEIRRPVQHEALHNSNAARAIAAFAQDKDAALIAMATHGATGLRRVALGSVTMAVVHCAPCPVLVSRAPHLPTHQEA